MAVTVEIGRQFVSDEDLEVIADKVKAAHQLIFNGGGPGEEFLGWVSLPENYDKEEFARIKDVARRIRETSDVLVSIGIGGSYLGARAVTDLLQPDNDDFEVIFAGKSLSARELNDIMWRLECRDWSINIISKSGTTTEPAVVFRVLRQKLIEKYGEEAANKRIFATTDREHGTLHDLAVDREWEMFVVPDDIGGRYSVLTAVGLLPIAAAGIDIDALMAGAAGARGDLIDEKNTAVQYAAARNILLGKGYDIEVMSCFEPSWASFNEWWKQLFGESEGKDGQGIMPNSMIFTTDLHSLGQYMQDGKRQIFESFVVIAEPISDIQIPEDSAEDDVGYLAGKNLSYINDKALEATIKAHSDGGVPVNVVRIPRIDAYEIGYFIYFMEVVCGVSAYVAGVNPFNQPGVEAYKRNMFALLGKV
ncbi:glucose-6-phosphate isomerase [Candidatus Saccharibacteria bacterium]|nr:glucose-6-phosphate isomerase [Candidatus Saccharibacteria bacterium]